MIATVLLIVLVAALAAFIGGYLLRDAPVRKIRVRGESARLSAGDARVRRAFEVLGKAPLETGNRIDLIDDGDRLFAQLLEDVRSAAKLVTWQVFWFKPGRLADRVADALIDRAGAGVEVLVLIDQVGSKGLPHAYVERLRAGGVNAQTYRPLKLKGLYKFPHRSHVRSIVIDSRVGYTGGFGIDDRWLGDGRSPGHWRDTHVRLEGPIVDHLQAPFVSNWAETTGELLFGEGVMEGAVVDGADAQRGAVMYCAPSLGSTNAERFVALTVAAATETLYVSSAYFIPNRGFRSLLCKAAANGVDVRVLTPGGNSDEPAAWYASRVHYEELLRGGVRIYEYGPSMMHAKTFVADGLWLSVGSINFDNRSLKLNDEVAFVAQDETLGRRLKEMFLRDLAYSEEVRLERFASRSQRERARERAAWLVSSLL